MRKLLLTGAAVALMSTSGAVSAKHHEEGGMAHSSSDLATVLKGDHRKDDMARDKYRHPAKTLKFFDVQPQHTVVEYGPGGGWYTKVLLPYLGGSGRYLATSADSANMTFSDRAREARTKSWPETFPARASEWTGVDAKKVTAFESDETPDDLKGKVDRILIFRSLHGMMNGARADSELRNLREMLADDGMIGVVQHRAKANAPFEMSKGTKGYLKQANVVAMFKLYGFDLVKASEINANAKDTANYEGGVWTLPPVLRYGDENKAKYEAIGESDRMTLLFKKSS